VPLGLVRERLGLRAAQPRLRRYEMTKHLAMLLATCIFACTAYAQSLEVPDSVKRDFVTVIQAYGFVCPSIVSVGDRGSDHYGRVFRVRCGPTSGKGSLDQFPQYLVTSRPTRLPLVKPCSNLPGMC
jgi:hypothetical protein